MFHVHGHTAYSQLDGVGSPAHHARVAADLGQQALAISDHGVLNGWLAHRKGCREEGIIPVFGVEAYWRPDRRVREKEWRYRRWHLILLAKNLAGWHNLIRLTSRAFDEGFYQNACIDNELLREHREGLICTTSCVSGPLAFLLRNGSDRQVNDHVDEFLSIFGDDLYFSIMPHAFAGQREHNVAVAQIAARVGRPVVHEKDKHYPEVGWEETQKIAILTGINKTFAESDLEAQKRIDAGEDPYELWHPNLNISTEQEDRALYAEHHPDLPESLIDEAMNSTEEILAKVNPISIDRTLKMPRVFVPENDSAKAQVLRWCREGMRRIGKHGDDVYERRLEYEVRVIDERGAFEYFLLVGDLIRWARSSDPLPPTDEDPEPQPKRPIRLNVRGSAAASLACYLTQISTLDPITHKFSFERFINPERKSMPDIDIDVASSWRWILKEYLARVQGRRAIADIVAFQHFQPRAALKAVAKTMYGFESEAYKRVAVLTHENTGCIDPVNDVDLDLIREREPDLSKWAEDFPVAWEHAVRLENHGDPSVLRMSKHAAGVAVYNGDISDVMPTVKADENEKTPRTAWAETSRVSVVDEIGIVKIDLLGLAGMDQQQMIVDMVEEHTGEVIDLDDLPALRDPYDVEGDVMEVFREGLTLGVNQFSGGGVSSFMKQVVPLNVADLTAVNAIYRPGPLGSGGHHRYVKRRHGRETYEVPEILHGVLDETYGCLVYQEQVMSLFQVLVGYSAGQADDVRKEIDKLNRSKNQEGRKKLDSRKDEFIKSATEKLGSEEGAVELWEWLLPYTGYAFNRPHAGSYSTQAYQDAWLKKHYPLFSYSTYLTLDEDKTLDYLREARHPMFGLSVLPPDVNVSGDGFTPDIEANAIRFGLRGIKGIGEAVAQQIVADRPFASLEDFEQRESRKYSKVNKKAREILIQVGALDSLGARSDWNSKTKAGFEAQLLGVALEPDGILGEDADFVRSNIHSEAEVAAMVEGQEVIVAGKVVDMNRTRVKKQGRMHGRAMATGIKVALDLEQYVCVCFPDQWDRFEEQLGGEGMVIIRGKLDSRGTVIINDVMDLEQFIREQKYEEVAA